MEQETARENPKAPEQPTVAMGKNVELPVINTYLYLQLYIRPGSRAFGIEVVWNDRPIPPIVSINLVA